jgi:hypothetical protein
MKKLLVSALILIFSLVSLSSQKMKDVLYLKNGNTIYDKLIEVNDSQRIIMTGSVFIDLSSEIEKFINESPLFEGREKRGIWITRQL